MSGRLSLATLDQLADHVGKPKYDPTRLAVGIVHMGIGAFHRAHQAVYIDDLLADGAGDWRILGVSLRSAGVRDQLAPQDGLFTLVERDQDDLNLRVIGAVAGVLVAPEDPCAVINIISDPAVHIVSLTITEKGYCYDPASGSINWQHPDIVHDLQQPNDPVSAIGYLAAGLNKRRQEGRGQITIMSCDNLPHNGAVLQSVLLAFAQKRDPQLAKWIEDNCSFPATMVDRIVPATTPSDIQDLEQSLGVSDLAMVKAEPFSQWVIEDKFAGPHPDFGSVGAQMVADVRPFELAKLRMLNGSHSTIAYLGLQKGYQTVDQAIGDPAIAQTIKRLMLVEAAATLPPVPGLDVVAYANALLVRFANSALQHQLKQIAMDGSQKLPQRLLGTIADCHARGIRATAAAQGVAAWILHLSGPYLNDPLADDLRNAIASPELEARLDQCLSTEAIFGALGREPWFKKLIHDAMITLKGVPA
jgi:fructuronate reductase